MKTYHKNPRTIKDKQFADLRAWLLELGDLSGIVHDLNTDEVISGNQRMRAIDIARCEIVLTEGPHEPDAQGTVAHGYVLWQGAKYNYRQVRWDARQCEKANIVANKAGGGWDFDTLANEFDMGDLLEWGFDAEELGFMAGDDAPDDPGAQIDKAEELREKWGVETGQLWQLGDHRLICGDCTDAAVVARVMGEEKADLLLSDPPYGKLKIFNSSGAVGNAGDNLAKVKNYGAYAGAHGFEIGPMLAALNGHYSKAIIWGGNYFTDVLPVTASWLVWDKRAGAQLFYADCELAWSDLGITAKMFTFVWQGMIRQGDKVEREHPTQKPVELYEWCLGLAEKAMIILDPTLGSASSLIACERLSRRCRAIEISPAYVAVALQRWADMTGGTPELVAVNSDLTVIPNG